MREIASKNRVLDQKLGSMIRDHIEFESLILHWVIGSGAASQELQFFVFSTNLTFLIVSTPSFLVLMHALVSMLPPNLVLGLIGFLVHAVLLQVLLMMPPPQLRPHVELVVVLNGFLMLVQLLLLRFLVAMKTVLMMPPQPHLRPQVDLVVVLNGFLMFVQLLLLRFLVVMKTVLMMPPPPQLRPQVDLVVVLNGVLVLVQLLLLCFLVVQTVLTMMQTTTTNLRPELLRVLMLRLADYAQP